MANISLSIYIMFIDTSSPDTRVVNTYRDRITWRSRQFDDKRFWTRPVRTNHEKVTTDGSEPKQGKIIQRTGTPRLMRNEGGRSENCTIFLEAWTDYALINGIYKFGLRRQIAHFRSVFGDSHRLFLNGLGIEHIENDTVHKIGEEPCASLKGLIDKLSEGYKCHRNVLFQRYMFQRAAQGDAETAKEFLQRMREQVKRCAGATTKVKC